MKIELKLIEKICDKYSIGIIELLGPGRRSKLIDARVDLVTQLRKRKFSYPEIGVLLGGRNHTTILKLAKKGKKKLSTN